MSEYEHMVRELARAFAACIARRTAEGKPGLPRWRKGDVRRRKLLRRVA